MLGAEWAEVHHLGGTLGHSRRPVPEWLEPSPREERRTAREIVGEALELYAAERPPIPTTPMEEPPPPPPTPRPGAARPIVFATCGLPMGGSSRQQLALISGLAELGYQVTIADTGPARRSPWPLPSGVTYMEGAPLRWLREADAVLWSNGALVNVPGAELLERSICVVRSSAASTHAMLRDRQRGLATHAVGVSQPAAQLGAAALGVPSTTIWTGHDPRELACASTAWCGKRDEFVIGYLGRYSQEKNIVAAMAALNWLPPRARLRCYGSGPLLHDLLACAEELGVRDRVDLGGVVRGPRWRTYLELDAVVLPSCFEGLPNVAIEAALAGVPVVACHHGDMPLIFRDGHRGIRVGPQPASIAAGLQRLLDDQNLAADIAENAEAFALNHLTRDVMVARYAALIEELR